MEFENLLFELKGRTALITVNRPDKLNALNHGTLDDMSKAFLNVKNSADTDCVVLTGAGEKAFVAGADIKELNDLKTLTGKKFAEFGQSVFSQIENLGKPVIAAVNGFALGGGCELALACHIRLASEKAKFGQPEVSLGIIPGYGGTQRFAKLTGTGIAAEYILTGNMFDAEEAMRIGLVNRVYSPDVLLSEALKMAETISSKGQIAVRTALESLLNARNLPLNNGLQFEAGLFGLCCGTADFKEGTSAFLEKRAPEFKNS